MTTEACRERRLAPELQGGVCGAFEAAQLQVWARVAWRAVPAMCAAALVPGPSGPLALWPSRASRDRVAARGRASVPIVRDRGMPPCIGHWGLTVGRCLAPQPRTNSSHRPTVRSSPYVGLDAVSKPITTRLETADPAFVVLTQHSLLLPHLPPPHTRLSTPNTRECSCMRSCT